MERTEIKQTENEQTEIAAHTAEADLNNGAAATEVSLGKFKDVNSLLKAYENLESEFTRRSRRLRELEGEMLKQKEEITRRGASSASDKHFEGGNPTTVGISENKNKADNDELSASGNEKSVGTKRAAVGENADFAFETDKKSTGDKLGEGKTPENETPKNETPENEKFASDNKSASESKAATDDKSAEDEKMAGDNGTADNTEEIVQAFLLSVLKSRPSFSPTLGTAVTAPPRRPRSFEEAGKMIKTDLDN